MFIRFEMIHERDGHMDRQTLHDDIGGGHACIALCSKNLLNKAIKLQH